MAKLSDISKMTGVSPSTVSRVINQDPTLSISHDKREKILEVAASLAYLSPRQRRQNQPEQQRIIARANYQRGHQSPIQLCVVYHHSAEQELDDPYFTYIRLGLEHKCQMHDITLKRVFKKDLSKHERELSQSNGVICVGNFTDAEIDYILSLNAQLVCVDYSPNALNVDTVLCDRTKAAEFVVNTMLKNGTQRPAFIGNQDERLQVFRALTQQQGLYDAARCIVSERFCIDSGFDGMNKMLRNCTAPDILFAATDIVAMGAIKAIHQHGIRIPEDIQVISINDIPSAEHLHPSLSTLRLYPHDMGETAVSLLLERFEGRCVSKSVIVGFQFIWRDSFLKNKSNKSK
ncbi:LacI family DNA-binding transcriptional regulator [Agarivorans sp. Z349TD_8]|uniref:LacI family DNA-binding transcriptional regulator n=1 Tax=Agarivorans sp. Z349TD_8 TaxID=3421434 RepID=UPI003D7D5B2E